MVNLRKTQSYFLKKCWIWIENRNSAITRFLAIFEISLYSLNKHCMLNLSHVQLFATTWTVAHQAPLSMGLSRQEYCSGLPFPFPGDLPDPGIKLGSPVLQAESLPTEVSEKPLFTLHSNKNYILYITCIWAQSLSHSNSFVTPWTVAHQAPPSM